VVALRGPSHELQLIRQLLPSCFWNDFNYSEEKRDVPWYELLRV